ncbi:PhoX family phosphatase [Ammoniphilus sp. 3BR4]|uniref:PhoX family protein n=1 Tax=Ammoniphilus sp. 3BR4 TaxID=3158265 RepID=UPI003465EE28
MENMNRRKFLGYLGTGAAALAAASAGLGTLAPTAEAASPADHLFETDKVKKTKKAQGFFKPIDIDWSNDLKLPEGFTYDVVAVYGDVINPAGDTFGYNADLNVFFPINGSSERGLLWTNCEYVTDSALIDSAMPASMQGSNLLTKQLYHQGGTIIEVYKDANGSWKMDPTSKYARRHNGLTAFKLVGKAAGSAAVGGATTVQGTWANCSGGMTLWNTVLSCEENYESQAKKAGLPSEHYGWVIEVDPFDVTDAGADKNFAPRKHTALGRFNHENTSMGLTKDGRIAVYMGDDKKDACIYKFVSNGKYNAAAGKENSKLLEDGTLYTADMKKGVWIPLDIEKTPKLKEKYSTQAEVLVNAQEAALLVGGTPTDRPEDTEISPFDNTIFIAHTNNDNHGNIHGHITRFYEKDGDLGSLEFTFEIFAAGGRQSGFSAPDNLSFDSNGNLWTVTDYSPRNDNIMGPFGNNSMFVIPTSGPNTGEAFRFASGPSGCELTGPWFTPDEKTLFLSVQHPDGTWPHRAGDTIARPGVVAIKGFKF